MTETKRPSYDRVKTGVKNLDALLNGGLPRLSVTLVGGSPGAGKTIFSEQFCFHNASPQSRALFVQTLSEPTVKTLRYLKQFRFFDPAKIEDGSIHFFDLGGILRGKGLEQTLAMLMEQIKRVKPAFVVIDSFKVFSDLAMSSEDIRKFTYETAINLMAWECTAFLLGEYTAEDLEGSPLSSIVDGIIVVTSKERSGEQQRFLQIVKMRGTDHDRDEHPFSISDNGIEVYAARLEVRKPGARRTTTVRYKTGISKFDPLIAGGIPGGASILVSGVSGMGKTVFCLETLYRGATEFHDKGIYFSFDETPEQLVANARSLGWDIERELNRGMLEIAYIPQTEILVERELLMIRDAIERVGAKRVAIDSISALFHKIKDVQIVREKLFQLTSLIRDSNALGLFCADVPFGSGQISAFGIEEAIVDGIFLLTSSEHGVNRERFLEVYKLRDTNHKTGRQRITIGKGGITVFSGNIRTCKKARKER